MDARRVGALAAAALALAACGADEEAPPEATGQDGGTGGAEPATLRIGETAGIPSAFLGYGEQLGIFEEHGLDLEVDTSAGGAATIPALVSGNFDLAGSNTVSVLRAGSEGLPLQIVAPGTFATRDPQSDFSAVLVPGGGEITDAGGLAGRSIAVNTLENIGDITITAALQERGIDPSGIEFVEIGFPDMLSALANGNVDAAWVIEPFLAIGKQQGNVPVLYPYAEAMEGLQVGSFVATPQYAQENAEVVESFRTAVGETAQAIADDPDAFRTALSDLQDVDPAVAAEMVLPEWGGEVDVESLEFLAEQMQEQGVVDEPIDVESLVPADAR
ncbi:ABC transporter substrate-binding protein [Georgenia sp. AZ-5]|uniref:ABC transporter substrate-binding protein n=1 Tax=Georgenia sp. AZ-5 TaxID=3367526 RepID=UPI0037542393